MYSCYISAHYNGNPIVEWKEQALKMIDGEFTIGIWL
jgi:hypothetical protein